MPHSIREHYLGWIPTVSGRLSFQTIGKAYNDGKAQRSLINVGNALYLMAWSERYTGDLAAPNIRSVREWIHKRQKRSGYHVFVILIRPNQDRGHLPPTLPLTQTPTPISSLSGTLYRISSQRFYDDTILSDKTLSTLAPTLQSALEGSGPRPWSFETLLHAFYKHIGSIDKTLYTEMETRNHRVRDIPETLFRTTNDTCATLHQELAKVLLSKAAHYADFSIEKDGLTTLYIGDQNLFDSDLLTGDHSPILARRKVRSYRRSAKNRDPAAPPPKGLRTISTTARQVTCQRRDYHNAITRHRIVDQLFYAIRDFSHAHKHHDPENDNFSQTYYLEHTFSTSWVPKIIADQHRRLVALTRDRCGNGARALGYSSYLLALEAILLRRFPKQVSQITPPYLRETQALSIHAILRDTPPQNTGSHALSLWIPLYFALLLATQTVSVTLVEETKDPKGLLSSLFGLLPKAIDSPVFSTLIIGTTGYLAFYGYKNSKKVRSFFGDLLSVARIMTPSRMLLYIVVMLMVLAASLSCLALIIP